MTLLQRRAANVLIHTVLNDKKTSHCRGTACQSSSKFLHHLLQKSPERGRGLWVQSTQPTVLLGGTTRVQRDPGHFRSCQHRASSSSRGRFTSSSCFNVLLGVPGFQRPALCYRLPGWKDSPTSAVIDFTQLYELLLEEETIRNTAAETAKCTFFPKKKSFCSALL